MLDPNRTGWSAVLLIVLGGCGQDVERALPPPALDDGWAVGAAGASGFDEAALARLSQDIETGEFPNTHALLVEHDGRLIFEEYFEGSDERWGDPLGHRVMGRDSLHDLRSVSKSVTSALLGIALASAEGNGATDFGAALDATLADYLPDLAMTPGAEAITLHDVLTMTAGFEWNETTVPYTDPTNDEIRTYDAIDPVAWIVTRPLRDPPGDVWYYSGGLTQLLAGIVHRLAARPLDDYAVETLFAPLGIAEFEWLGAPTWDPRQPAAMSGLRLRARDLAKIGSLYLHEGRWNGQPVLPADWVERSMERHVEEIGDWSDGGIWGYGYQWWHGRFPEGYTAVTAVGNGNQRVFVLPYERIVVTVFAGEYNVFEGHSERLLHRVMAARR
jgi:CubicO group peptidase (beta-lactamase class C family)